MARIDDQSAENRRRGYTSDGRVENSGSRSGTRKSGKTYGRKKKRKIRWMKLFFMAVIGMVLLIILGSLGRMVKRVLYGGQTRNAGDYAYVADREIEERPDLDVELIEVNPYSRPGIPLEEVHGIVIHYTANPGTSAMQNRDYFAGLAEEKTTKASSHFIVGLEGEIVQCIPCQEIAYASNNRNSDTISIECCIEGEDGKFNKETYASLVELTAWLMGRYDLNAEDVIRHYDVTEKICPKYFVEHPEAWDQFRQDITDYMLEKGTK